MTIMWGVFVAPYVRPMSPFSSSRIGCSIENVFAPSRFASTPCPCLPAAAEFTASHTTPFFVCFFAASLSEPFVCAFFTYGHPGLNHSRTTTFPLKEESFTSLPSRSFSVKSGAGLPTSALVIVADEDVVVFVAVVTEAVVAGGAEDFGELHAKRATEKQAARTNRMPAFLALRRSAV